MNELATGTGNINPRATEMIWPAGPQGSYDTPKITVLPPDGTPYMGQKWFAVSVLGQRPEGTIVFDGGTRSAYNAAEEAVEVPFTT